MIDFLTEYGVIGLFIAAFLAATILPLSSEVLLSALIVSGLSTPLLVTVATAGNVLGSLVNYGLGYWCSLHLVQQWLGVTAESFERAKRWFSRWGIYSLLFAWVPIVGDPLTLVAGVMRVRLLWFLLLVTVGKGARYLVVATLVSPVQ